MTVLHYSSKSSKSRLKYLKIENKILSENNNISKMSCIYLNADVNVCLPSFDLERHFKADFVFDKAYPKEKFEDYIPEYVYTDTYNYEFDPVMWYCTQMNENYCEIKWWDTPNGNNTYNSIWCGDEEEGQDAEEKEIFPYNTPIKCEEQVIGKGIGKSKKRTFWLKKVVLEEKLTNGDVKYTSCMAEGKKKNGIYKIKNLDKNDEPSGWEYILKKGKKPSKNFKNFIKNQGIDMSKNVKNVFSEIQPDGKIR